MGTNMKRWSDLSPATRRAITIGAAVDMSLRAVAIADLVKRPQSQVRGSKTLWAVALAVIGSVGLVPVAYLAWGRRD
jgi:hypothetical protein